jgi:hypothetical protein
LKALLTISLLFCLSVASGQTLVGYIKNSSSFFPASNALGLTNVNQAAYITGKQFGQVGFGDIIRDAGGTAVNGGQTWWGFSKVNGGTSTYRGYKIDFNGAVMDIVFPTLGLTPSAYWNGVNLQDCSQAGYTTPIYGPADDPGMYNNAFRYASNGGGLFTNGINLTASYASGGPSFWKCGYTTSNSHVTGVTCCSTSPVANAGADQTVTLPAPLINLTGSGLDCDGYIASYLWSNFSGPNTPTLVNANMQNASVDETSVIPGIYVFKLTVTDDLGNTGIDFVTVEVVAAALCSPCTVVQLLPRGCWNLTGSAGFGGQRMNDTTGARKWPSVLGSGWPLFDHAASTDPRHGLFDFNDAQAGVNPDTTSIIMIRSIIHQGNSAGGQTYPSYFHLGNGNQQVFYVDAERPVDWDALYIKTNGVAVANAFEVIFTDDPLEVRRAVFEYTGKYGSPTIYRTVSLTNSATGWDSVINIRATGRFMIIRTNPNDGNSPKQGPGIYSIIPYGADHPGAFTRSAITPNWLLSVPADIPRDTTYPVVYHSGKVIAAGGPTSNFPYTRMFGGYLNPTDTAASHGGQSDTTNKAWVQGPSGSVIDASFKIYLAPYGDFNIFNPANRPSQELESYMAVTNNNRYLMKQLYNNGTINNQHIPIDKLGLDIRLRENYGRFVWYYNGIYAALNHYTPNGSSPFAAYIPTSRIVGYWGGGSGYANGVKEYMPPGNEENLDFRPGDIAQSSWLPPVAFYEFHDTLQTVFHSLYPGVPFVMQGLAANGFDYLFIGEMLGKIEHLDANYTMCDMVNWHGVTVLNVPDIDGGCTGNINQQSVFGNYRGMGAYMQFTFDTLAIFSGRWRDGMQTEYSVGSSRGWKLPVTGCDFNVQSVPGPLANRPTYRPADQQAFLKLDHQITINERVRGISRSWQYEAYDLTDSTGPYYDGNDGSQGDINLANSWQKPGKYVSGEHNLWMAGYRNIQVQSDSLNGQYKALYRKVWPAKTDSFVVVAKWTAWSDPVGMRTHFLASDVTTVLHRRISYPDATYAGTTMGTTVNPTTHSVTIPLTFEPDYLFFKSPATAASLDNQLPVARAGADQAITLPVATVTVDGSTSSDADGTITAYAWTKISGPSTFSIINPTSASTVINALVAGVYVFQLQVTDNAGGTGTDTITITVNPAIVPPGGAILINHRILQ